MNILKAGGKVAINGRAMTEEAAALQQQFGDESVAVITGDVSDPDQAEKLVKDTAEFFGRLDILVHSAGGPAPGTILQLDAEAWKSAFDIHVHPVFTLFRAAHPHLAKEGGAVILLSSVAGIRGCPGTVAYQTVKGALIPMAKALAMDHARENIRVSVLAPGIIRTRFHENMTDAAMQHNLDNRIPLHREGSVENVASAAMQLIENDFITGETIVIDGGMSMRVAG